MRLPPAPTQQVFSYCCCWLSRARRQLASRISRAAAPAAAGASPRLHFAEVLEEDEPRRAVLGARARCRRVIEGRVPKVSWAPTRRWARICVGGVVVEKGVEAVAGGVSWSRTWRRTRAARGTFARSSSRRASRPAWRAGRSRRRRRVGIVAGGVHHRPVGPDDLRGAWQGVVAVLHHPRCTSPRSCC